MRKSCVLLLVGAVAAAPWLFAEALGTDTALDALTRQQNYEVRRESSSNEDLSGNNDSRTIAPGETLVLADLAGPGVITEFWNTVGADDPFYGRTLVLRVYYNGNEKPSVETPLGDFFGLGHGNVHKDFSSIPVVVTGLGRSRTCFWRMPFRERFRMTVTNDSATEAISSFYFHVNWRKYESLPTDTAYFHAKYRQEFPAKPGNYTILDTKGRGHYVGTVYSAHQVELGWFGEGDDFFYIDGAEKPRLRGTGTEEYFLDAWGFREYASPYAGAPLYEGVLPGDRVSVYRWHIQDPIAFKESLHFEFEHKGSVYQEKGTLAEMELASYTERPDWLSSVAFWYQYPPVTFDEPLPPVEQRMAPYRTLCPGKMTFRADPPALVVPSETGLTYMPCVPEASIELDFDLDLDGRYNITAVFFYGVITGIYQVSLDGEKLGLPMDFVAGGYTPVFVSLDTHELKAGTHTLRFESVNAIAPKGRRNLPKLNCLAFERLFLLRLEDMAGYHEVLNRLLKKE
ncbi:MAG TPA: DUF2961 domain-containing protein [Candidatus Hydrogenedentes bacterium]|nr:DUF2961 domain-containing protein [Candidatus Hydrogenedentota bacterium]